MTVTREQIIKNIKENLSFTGDKSYLLVNHIIDCLQEGFLKDGKIMISNFASFRVHPKKQRIGRNPKTGEKAIISERRVICFEFAASFKKEVNQGNK